MDKMHNGKLVPLTETEKLVRKSEMSDGASLALQQAKDFLIWQVDQEVEKILKASRLADVKQAIREARTREEALAIYAKIDWSKAHGSGTHSEKVSHTVIHERYDDSWLRPQLESFTDALTDVRGRIEGWENALSEITARSIQTQADRTPAQPLEITGPPDPVIAVDFKSMMDRVEAAEAAEAGLDPAELPPIEIEQIPPGPYVPPRQRGAEPDYNDGITSKELQEIDPVNPAFFDAMEDVNKREDLRKIVEEVVAEALTNLEPRDGEDTKGKPKKPGTSDEYLQIRYEMAMMAINGDTDYKALLAREAKARGVSVLTLAHKIVEQRKKKEEEVALHFAMEAEG
jgi:hypothetical protein